eukprot:8740552-Karenia_brevis.AAC.1
MPLLVAHLSLPWDSDVLASDSSEAGFGVMHRVLNPQIVARWGRVSERWRFLHEDAVSARKHALADPTRLDCQSLEFLEDGHTCAHLHGFTEVDSEFLRESDWSYIYNDRWQFQENILRTEGRALEWSIRHKLRSSKNFGKRHVFLVDNLSLALAANKGRSTTNSAHLIPTLR